MRNLLIRSKMLCRKITQGSSGTTGYDAKVTEAKIDSIITQILKQSLRTAQWNRWTKSVMRVKLQGHCPQKTVIFGAAFSLDHRSNEYAAAG